MSIERFFGLIGNFFGLIIYLLEQGGVLPTTTKKLNFDQRNL
jgi:hypothetical protein